MMFDIILKVNTFSEAIMNEKIVGIKCRIITVKSRHRVARKIRKIKLKF